MEEKNKENKKENMLSGFFDRCRDFYSDGSRPLNFIEESTTKQKVKEKTIAEIKLNKIKKILEE